MEAMSGLTGTDALALMNNRDGFGYGDGAWFWIIIILFAFWGNGFNRNNGLETDIDTRFLERDIFNTNQNVSTTGCQTQRDVLETKYDLGTQVLENRFNCSQNACATQKEVLQNRYDNALQTQTLSAQMAQCCCDLRAEGLANTQKVIDLIQQDKIDQLREQINTSNLALFGANLATQITNNVRPFPTPSYIVSSPYTSLYNPYNGCACNNTTII
jgi:hypothetical protein